MLVRKGLKYPITIIRQLFEDLAKLRKFYKINQ